MLLNNIIVENIMRTECKVSWLVFTIALVPLSTLLQKLFLKINLITEKEKCPACYGTSFCDIIENNEISLVYNDFYSIFNNLFSVKNVYYGKYKNKEVVLKKLAHNHELKQFDNDLCDNWPLFCTKDLQNDSDNKYEKLFFEELSHVEVSDPDNKLTICPITNNIKNLFNNLYEDIHKHGQWNSDIYKYLLTLIKINPEPIIIQLLPSKDGWPTANYLGSCGRLIIEENVGPPLSDFYKEPWINRARIAASLLESAYKLTFKNNDFSFYLTDTSTDNININKEYKAIFTDLEHIIIVDKNPLEKTKEWEKIHVSEIFADCPDCFLFSPQDICKHNISDHNYYAICKHILLPGYESNQNRGLLHSIPQDIKILYPQLKNLIRQCAKPDNTTRITAGIQLKNTLEEILKNF